MTCKESIKWLENLKSDLGESQFSELWHYEQALAETIELLQSDRLVELPCNVEDEAYYISVKRYSPLSYKLLKAKVIDLSINRNGIYAVELKTIKSDFTFTLDIRKVYFDKSKAEAKLKELNNETT